MICYPGIHLTTRTYSNGPYCATLQLCEQACATGTVNGAACSVVVYCTGDQTRICSQGTCWFSTSAGLDAGVVDNKANMTTCAVTCTLKIKKQMRMSGHSRTGHIFKVRYGIIFFSAQGWFTGRKLSTVIKLVHIVGATGRLYIHEIFTVKICITYKTMKRAFNVTISH